MVAPHVAGHLLGGTVWKITKDGEDVIYAVDYNRRKEKYMSYQSLHSNCTMCIHIFEATKRPYQCGFVTGI